jgi:glycerol kinase
LATGFWASPQQLQAQRVAAATDVRFEPKMTAEERDRRRALWQRAVERAGNWSE